MAGSRKPPSTDDKDKKFFESIQRSAANAGKRPKLKVNPSMQEQQEFLNNIQKKAKSLTERPSMKVNKPLNAGESHSTFMKPASKANLPATDANPSDENLSRKIKK